MVIAFNAKPAMAAVDPYTSGMTGYDVSHVQCPGTTPPAGMFGIVGVNNGRPFTSNACLGTEYSAAPATPSPSFYINAAYSGAYKRYITAGCSSGGTQAWEIGCSEADYSLRQASGRTASMWWLDVETANSWSTSNLALNQQAIQGAVDRLNQTGLPVGVYSTTSMWRTITGGSFTPNNLAADWVAAGSCSTPFTN